MQTPLIHSNGTSGRELARGYAHARITVEDAIADLCSVEFNARDYYPLGASAWATAQQEHEVRLTKLREVAEELRELEAHCATFARP